MLKKLLQEEHAGFSGITHWLISILFFFCLWLIPWTVSHQYVDTITESTAFTIMIFFLIGGAALLPDLDSSPLQEGGSTAVYQLGFLGNALSLLAIIISGVVYSVLHTKYDQKPKSQHRMLWHTPFIAIAIFLYTWFFMDIPNEGSSLIDGIKSVGFEDVRLYSMAILIFFAGCSIYLGSSMIVYKILKLFKKQKYCQFVCLSIMLISIIYMLWLPGSQLRLVGISIALGYLFHIIGDMFSKGSAPFFFPIPIPYNIAKQTKLQFWHKPKIPFALTTGGIGNKILNFVLTIADFALAYTLFFR